MNDMPYDPDMELAYEDDATSIEVHIEIIDPNEPTNRAGVVTDNLTSAMYFLVAHNLKPAREGLRELGTLRHPELPPEDAETLRKAALPIPSDLLEAYRTKNNLPLALYIEVYGDPKLIDGFH